MLSHSEIILEPWEQSLATILGGLRQGLSSANGDKDTRKKSPRDPYAIQVEGMGGELAFARMRNLCPLLNFLPTQGGADMFTRQGKSIDVKTTSKPDGDLLVSPHKRQDPCDFYVLMVADFPSYQCKGWATRQDLFKDENLRDLGHGKVYLINQENLTQLT
jgi:hypothetical protein